MPNSAIQRSSSFCFGKQNTTKTKYPSSALPQHRQNRKLREFLSSKIQENFLDKKQTVLINSLKHLEPHIVKDLEDLNESLMHERLTEREKLKNDVLAIEQHLKDLKSDIIGDTKEIDLESFKQKLMQLEWKFATLKEEFQKQFSLLRHQEQDLQEELTSVAKKIDEWEKPMKINTVLPRIYHSGTILSERNSSNEFVNNFQKFLQDRGGHTGGWDESDHLIFLRLFRKHRNKQILYSHLLRELPDKTREILCEHYQWYTEYEDLKVKQKQAIAEWRSVKKNSVQRTVNCIETSTMQVISKGVQREDYNEYREKQKQRLKEWKNMKQNEMKIEILKKQEEQEKQLIEEEARKMRHAIQKAELERYKKEKLKKELSVVLLKETLENIQAEERACNANKTLIAFRQRDAEILARKKEMKSHREKEQNTKEKSLEVLRQKVRVEVARDPHRLLRPTGAWKEHIKFVKNVEAKSYRSSVPLNVQEVPHLGIPLWRKNQK